MSDLQRVLCAIDGSDHAAMALAHAIDMCAESGATLYAVVVAETGVDRRERAEEIASAAAADAEARGVTATPHVVTGEPAHAICVAAEELNADIVVMGSRGHGAITSALLGSVSRAVSKECSRPVTVVATVDVPTNPVTGQPRR
jgi:nucleotide-binding universal stress UspA family protein